MSSLFVLALIFFCLQIMSDQFRHICSFVPHCILYHHNGSMSSLFFRVGVFFETFNVRHLWNCNRSWMWRSYVAVDCNRSWMWGTYVAVVSAVIECSMWRSYVVRGMADRVLRLLCMGRFCDVWVVGGIFACSRRNFAALAVGSLRLVVNYLILSG